MPYPEAQILNRPKWMQDTDELPHQPEPSEAGWNETYLAYMYSPESDTGLYYHLRHVPQPDFSPGIWDVLVYVTLPNARVLVSRFFAPAEIDMAPNGTGEMNIGGFKMRIDQPFGKVSWSVRTAARLVSEEEMRRGPLKEGGHINMSLEFDFVAMTPPWDHATDQITGDELDCSFAKKHFAQHVRGAAKVTFAGETIEFQGLGLRDHSWGPRSFNAMPHTTWHHGRFEDGNSFSITMVPGTDLHPGMHDPKVCRSDQVRYTAVEGIVHADTPEQALVPTEFRLTDLDGNVATVRSTPIRPMFMHFRAPSEFCFGAPDDDPAITHAYLPMFAEIEWGGQVCPGYNERCVRLKRG